MMPPLALADLPQLIQSESELEELLTRPSPELIADIQQVRSPLLILGASGKMGPTMAVLAHRAAQLANHPLEVIAASRFSDPAKRAWLEACGVKTIACDFLAQGGLRQLPDAENLIYLVGMKFGTDKDPAQTWAINTLIPGRVTERYPHGRVVALSTGNVYPLSNPARGGSTETDPLVPLGEYGNASVGRERLFEFGSRRDGTRVALLRLYYAVEMRYGVLVDIARKIHLGEPVELANGWFTCIWQGDANEMILRSLPLASTPPTAWNLARPCLYSVREVATRLAVLLDRPVRFEGTESSSALVGNSARLCDRLGPPRTPIDLILKWTAQWVRANGCHLSKPTHFEVRDGKY